MTRTSQIDDASRADTRVWPMAFSSSIVLHVAAFSLIVSGWLPSCTSSAAPSSSEAEKEKKVIKLSFAAATPAAPEPAIVTPPPPEVKDEQKFVDTTEEQAGEPAPDTENIGARDTRASGDTAPTAGASGIAQDGDREAKTDDTFDRRTQLGEGETAQPIVPPSENTAEVGVSNEAPEVEPNDSQESESDEQTPESRKSADSAEAEPVPPVGRDFSERERELTVPETPTDPVEKPEQPEVNPPPQEAAKAANKRILPKSEDPFFSGVRRKNFREGSIGRREDQSAEDVKRTPLGRYHKAVLDAVEKQWRFNTHKYGDHILPGQIAIHFLVGKDGQPFRVRFMNQIDGGAVQNGFTIRSVKTAKIPKMKPDVIDELEGDPLELLIRFNF